ncbi:hypothetical protein [Pseudarthrobacter sp. H2]|uniref:hypothetical protein n=1 Tax=Pseudarthrobacter sp. H2 TaxID=3418415 RepID=UPI003CFA5700
MTELKSRQPTGSALVKRSYISQTANSFDLSAYSIPANTTQFFYITFTGDGTQAEPYGIQYSQIYNNGTDSAHRLSDYQQYDSTDTFYFSQAVRPSPFIGPNKMTWTVGIGAGPSGASVYIKMRVMVSCKGSSLALTY